MGSHRVRASDVIAPARYVFASSTLSGRTQHAYLVALTLSHPSVRTEYPILIALGTLIPIGMT